MIYETKYFSDEGARFHKTSMVPRNVSQPRLGFLSLSVRPPILSPSLSLSLSLVLSVAFQNLARWFWKLLTMWKTFPGKSVIGSCLRRGRRLEVRWAHSNFKGFKNTSNDPLKKIGGGFYQPKIAVSWGKIAKYLLENMLVHSLLSTCISNFSTSFETQNWKGRSPFSGIFFYNLRLCHVNL